MKSWAGLRNASVDFRAFIFFSRARPNHEVTEVGSVKWIAVQVNLKGWEVISREDSREREDSK